MKHPKFTGRCASLFLIAIFFDIVGIVLLILGVCARFDFWDFFIYTSAVVIGFSMVFWVLWYTFNVISPEEMELTF
ncbi:hypothetical protein GDO78_014151 [Eleutherodactylus coqui]|uniref:Transmembrane protein 238 n=1 Tax=Eleutherodactylus coqui TaxID=57060 RepID=A0A8J6EET3_ELECQ|nr:hypothetical protein GDO78_014151 [Eleutherodactylus coqui]